MTDNPNASEAIGYRMHAMHDPDSIRGTSDAREILAAYMEPQFPVEAYMARKGLHFMLPSSWAVEAIQRALESRQPFDTLARAQAAEAKAVGALEQAAADFDDHAYHAQTRIEDGEELGATVWKIALQDIKQEAVDNAACARSTLSSIKDAEHG